MVDVPVTKYQMENPFAVKTTIPVDLSFMLNNSTPNPMFQEMHKTIYSLITMTFGFTSIGILIVRLFMKDIELGINLIGELSSFYAIAYLCIQSKICLDIILEEERRGIEEHVEESESNRVYIVLSGCGSTVGMLIYVISCQIDSKLSYHVGGVWLCISFCLFIISVHQIKTRKNYTFFIVLGITYICALTIILK